MIDTTAERVRDEDGASAVEYGLLIVAIAALIAFLIFAIGGMVTDMFQNTCSDFDSGDFSHTAASC